MTMEGTTEKDCSPLWSLYQQIVSDLKNHAPMWEEFISKASKLHSALKSALMAIAAFLDSFQKIADAATNARGATKEIGTALTRVCLRHRAIETRMKTFISALMDTLITPLSDRADDWRRGALCGALSREHARDVKRARAELRRRTLDVHRSARKPRRPAPDAKRRADVCMQDLQERKQQLEEMEERAVKAALVEERSRFCHFVSLLNPVVECEVAMLAEVGHLQEGAEQLVRHTAEPRTLPPASLQVICDIKTASAAWCDADTSSPPASRLGSRKSSLTSICSGHSQCSGELHGSTVSCSTPISSASSAGTLPANNESHCLSQGSDNQSISSECAPPAAGLDDARDGLGNAASATWPDLKDTAQFERAASAIMGGRPHTISAAYERGHPRPALSVHTFTSEQEVSGALTPREGIYARPPLPTRCSSLERPAVPAKTPNAGQGNSHHEFKAKPSSLPPHLTKEMPQAVYVNMSELATLAASRAQQQQQQQAQQQQHAASEHPHQEKVCSESSASESSLESSSGYGSQGAFAAEDHQHHQMQTHPEVEIVTLRRECESIAAARDSFSVSLGSLEEAVRSLDEATEPPAFATIGKKPAVPKRRPLSMTGVTAAAWSRRGSSSSLGKPPPPVRRSSSISRPQRPPQPGTPQSPLQPHDADNLPPPPAFLLQPDGDAITAHQNSVAETIKQLTEIKHMPASPGVVRRGLQQFQSQSNQCQSPTQLSTFQKSFSPHGSVNPIYGAGGRLLESALSSRKNSLNASASDLFREGGPLSAGTPPGAAPFSSFGPRGTDSHYGQTGFKIQQDKKYGQTGIYAQPAALAGQSGPAGPAGPMGQGGPMAGHCGTRNPLSPLALRKNIAARSHSADRHGDQGSLIAALSAKLAPPSPRAARRPSGGGLGDSPPKGKGTVPSTVQPSFLDKLAATLQQRGRPPRAVAVRDAINKHAQPDPRVCHTSLMEQIKRGATLRRNNHCNDRSAPKIR